MHKKQVVIKGPKLGEADKVLIMLHGRGASAEDILSLSAYLNVKEYSLIAPQATGASWYPYSFLAVPSQNEPWLSSALSMINEVVQDVANEGITKDKIYIAGFSQGACLTLEYAARNATKYGGIAAFTGGLIGDKVYSKNYAGDFKQTPIFIGTSDTDPHVPVERVNISAKLLKQMNAAVTEKVYKNMGHTINNDEIETANKLIFTI